MQSFGRRLIPKIVAYLSCSAEDIKSHLVLGWTPNHNCIIPYLLLPPKNGCRPNIPPVVSCMRRGVPSTVVPALITLLFLPGCVVVLPLPASPALGGGGSEPCSPNIHEQLPKNTSSRPVDSSHPLILELLDMIQTDQETCSDPS
jgi:hypothetical protein